MRNRVCKTCAKSVPRKEMLTKHFCSAACSIVNTKKRSCEGSCLQETLKTRQVTFQGGSKHIQQYCMLCRKTKYLGAVRGPKATAAPSLESQIQKELRKKSRDIATKYSESFYSSVQWLRVRLEVLKRFGPKCMACNAVDAEIHVDHIKPRSKYPHLELNLDNLQILCKPCNLGKGAWDETDFRPQSLVNQT